MIAISAWLTVPWFAATTPMPREFAVAQHVSAFVAQTRTLLILFFICHNHLTSNILAELFSLTTGIIILSINFSCSIPQPLIKLPLL